MTYECSRGYEEKKGGDRQAGHHHIDFSGDQDNLIRTSFVLVSKITILYHVYGFLIHTRNL